MPGEETTQVSARMLDAVEALGESGRYLSVLDWASENGLSLGTRGREWEAATPRSTSSSAAASTLQKLPTEVTQVPSSSKRARAVGLFA